VRCAPVRFEKNPGALLQGGKIAVTARRRKYAVVFDLEFTGWEGSLQSRWSRPQEYPEVIQIGAVKLEATSLKEVDEFEILVKPRVNPVLSDYLTQVTSITNQMVDAAGVDFITAYRAFLDFVGEAHIYAFGRDDLVFAENLKLYGWTTLPIPPYVNGNPWFKAQGIDLKGKHACDVGELAGVAFAGRKHTALADARGVASGFVALIKKGAPNLFLGD
jgi:inhibitor of KinA sporulation pathway (predicted exonuclease)